MNQDEDMENIEFAYQQFPYFKKFHENCLSELYEMSFIRRFQRDDIILGLGEGLPDYAYFVLRGECVTIQVLHRQIKKKRRKSCRKMTENDSYSNTKTPIFAQICFFMQGATFNLGEEFEQKKSSRCVVAHSLDVWCLLVPRERLLLQHNSDNIWTRLTMLLQDRLPPSSEHLLANISKARHWDTMSTKIVRDIVLHNSRATG